MEKKNPWSDIGTKVSRIRSETKAAIAANEKACDAAIAQIQNKSDEECVTLQEDGETQINVLFTGLTEQSHALLSSERPTQVLRGFVQLLLIKEGLYFKDTVKITPLFKGEETIATLTMEGEKFTIEIKSEDYFTNTEFKIKGYFEKLFSDDSLYALDVSGNYYIGSDNGSPARTGNYGPADAFARTLGVLQAHFKTPLKKELEKQE